MEWVYGKSGGQVVRTSWRTHLVLAHTFWASIRVMGHAARTHLSPEYVDQTILRWCRHVFAVSRTALRTERTGLTQEPCVLLSNHMSLLDIPAVCASYPGRVRFVAKQELRKVPAFGPAMAASGILFVDRSDRAKAIEQLRAARGLLLDGTSLWIAAEGSRSRDGRLHAFKKGGFHVAMELGVPIVPTWIQGTLDVLPPDQWASVTEQVVTVWYGRAIPTDGCTREDLPRLMDEARTEMLRLATLAGARPDVDGLAS